MAWLCVRCQRKIFAPREQAIRFAMLWKYVKIRNELTMDLKNLKDIKDNATVTHAPCEIPEVEGFKDRMKASLKMPESADHPLLI